ncbi:hypothetical protein A7P95_01400 [Eikenella longinqua]|uniref:Serine/threonine protein kinase n=1 Tax=Eikenella longinqua TaxID=1795827 RepID=A0A1A9S171_9NEIS|nr:hypothetical protein [Eikenella longinqua]OAM31180.1 hypothetical protein A7P95_01400 [Eikenella longinqua]
MDYAAQLASLAAAQTATIARHTLSNGETVWLRKAAPRQAAWRYSLLNGLGKILRLGVLTPVPNPGGNAGIAIEAGRLRELAAAGITAPRLLAVQENALLMSHVGEQTLLIAIEKQIETGSLEGWLQGLHAIEAVHRQGQYLSQAFARNMVLTAEGGIGFIDFEDNPALVLSLPLCQGRDWLCYLQSTADNLRRQGLLDQAAGLCKTCLSRQNPAIIRTLQRSVRPLSWMRGIQSERWGCDTLRLAALADLFYRMGKI